MEYIYHILIIFLIYGGLSLALNMLVGWTGLLSLASVAFYGIGAYTYGILNTTFDISFWWAILLAGIIAFVTSFLLSFALSKFKEDYYALITLGIAIIIQNLFLNLRDITRGALGIPGIERPEIFGIDFSSNFKFLILLFIIFSIILIISYFISRSSFGKTLKAIREDEKAISIFGFNVFKYKTIIFVISSIITAILGVVYASYISFIDPGSFNVNGSVLILSMIILGGLAKNRGALLGAFILVVLPELLRFVGLPDSIVGTAHQAIFSLILVLFVMYKPNGLVGEYKL